MQYKLISDRRHQYPAIRSLSELFVCSEFAAYDSRQKCFVARDPLSKQIPEQMFPFDVDRQGNVLYFQFHLKSPNTEMKAEIQNQIGKLVRDSETQRYSVLISDST